MLQCLQCGVEDLNEQMVKRVERGKEPICPSCSARPVKTLRTHYGICRPWGGPFDEYDNPLDAATGEFYRPGKRLCGYRDCVAPSHVELPPNVTEQDLQLLVGIRKSRGSKAAAAWLELIGEFFGR